MLLVLSPAKKLDYATPLATQKHSIPELMTESENLVGKLKKMSAKKIGKLMDLSTNLSELNYERFQQWTPDFSPENARQSVLAF